MKDRKRPITDEELDALLAGTPVTTGDAFADRTLIKATSVTVTEVDALLSGDLVYISPDFTERTLARIEESGSAMIFEFPAMRWLVRSGLAAAVLMIGMFAYSIWQNQAPTVVVQEVAQANLAEMELEELLFLEETLTSAKFLIELEKTVPLNYFIDEADS
ncbi:MAG: hypothetical protein P8L44_10085 [Opitutales bacterium]|jgi:hypothetical protein|nr:hypothetical protein [Opitutales bacterium]